MTPNKPELHRGYFTIKNNEVIVTTYYQENEWVFTFDLNLLPKGLDRQSNEVWLEVSPSLSASKPHVKLSPPPKASISSTDIQEALTWAKKEFDF